MPRQLRVFRYFVFGLLGWVVVSVLALAIPGEIALSLNRTLSDWPFVSSHLAAYGQPTAENPTAENPTAENPIIEEPAPEEPIPEELEGGVPPEGFSPPGAPGRPGEPPETLRPFEEVTAQLEKQTGLFTTYSDLETGTTYLALLPEQLNQNFLLVSSIEAGLGEAGLLRGWPINDLLVQFREAPEDKLQVLVPNTFVRNPGGQNWQQRLLESSFSDSILFAIEVVSVDPDSQAKLIDLSDLIMARDLANIKDSLGPAVEGYSRSPELSRIDSLNAFENNIEMGTTVGFSSDGSRSPFSLASLFGFSLQGLPDDRGFSIGIRYSFSALPTQNGYQPRPADERVGYFISAFRAPPRMGTTDPFVRYIHRWNLEKQTPTQAVSKPKAPIVFWLENTVPPEYRASLTKGVLLWNEAFEQAGFKDAIEVRQMPYNADWDPADMRYNVIRWSDSLRSGVAGLGPSRVNPLTGEILDADIILDANNIRSLQRAYRTLTGGQNTGPGTTDAWGAAATCVQPSQNWDLQWQALQQLGSEGLNKLRNPSEEFSRYAHALEEQCNESVGAQQVAFGALALDMTSHLSQSQLDDYVQQFLVMLTAHEVGHTLGLRHNFAGSGSLPPEVLNNLTVTRSQGLTNSIMDYVPPNIAPPGVAQGDFFPTQLGAYDIWAIQYGYQTVASSSFPLVTTTAAAATANQSTQAAANQSVETAAQSTTQTADRTQLMTLRQIANRGSAPELAYAADEDIADFIDPEVNAWDLSNDPLQFAQWQLDNSQAVWQQLNRLSVGRDEGYGGLRRRVEIVFRYFSKNTLTLTNYIGGQRFRRLSPWESNAAAQTVRTPLEPIPATKQRAALALLNQKVFAIDAFQFSPQFLNQLPPDRWSHQGLRLSAEPLDYPIYDAVLRVQSLALTNLLSAQRLSRVRDLEFKSNSDDVLTIAELLDTVYQGIWTEVANPGDVPREQTANLSSLRRGLQRQHLSILSNLVLRKGGAALGEAQSFMDFIALAGTLGAPEDARLLARYQLTYMYDDVGRALRRQGSTMEVTTRAHWEDVRDRISRVLEAPLSGT